MRAPVRAAKVPDGFTFRNFLKPTRPARPFEPSQQSHRSQRSAPCGPAWARGPCGVRCRAPRRAGRPASRVRARRWLSPSRAVVLVVLVVRAWELGLGHAHGSRVDRTRGELVLRSYSFTYAPARRRRLAAPPDPIQCGATWVGSLRRETRTSPLRYTALQGSRAPGALIADTDCASGEPRRARTWKTGRDASCVAA